MIIFKICRICHIDVYKRQLSQRSVERIDKVELYPAGDSGKAFAAEKKVTLIDYFGPDTLLVMDDPVKSAARAEAVEAEFSESIEKRLKSGIGADLKTTPKNSSKKNVNAPVTGDEDELNRCLLYTSPLCCRA